MLHQLRLLGACMLTAAVCVALLNVIANLLLTQSMPEFQLDMSVQGDLFGFHDNRHDHEHSDDDNKRAEVAKSGNDKGPSSKTDGDNSLPNRNDLLLTQNKNCMGICSSSATNSNADKFTQSLYVRRLIDKKLANVVTPGVQQTICVQKHSDTEETVVDIKKMWQKANYWLLPRQIAPLSENLGDILQAMRTARITTSSTLTKGIQPKMLLMLAGDQQALFKPQRYALNESVPGGPYEGFDRHTSEIAAFYLSRLLGMNRVPIATGRLVNSSEMLATADERLMQSLFYDSSHRLCIYRHGRCAYCSKEYAVCESVPSRQWAGSISLWLPSQARLAVARHPWARNYTGGDAAWELDQDYCLNDVHNKLVLGKAPYFLDLMDLAVFDFLLGNADRHLVEVIDSEPPGVLYIDNGKGLRRSDRDEITILAPLYQCCKLRSRTYNLLLYLKGANIGQALSAATANDHLCPILTLNDLLAVNRRLEKILALLSICIERRGTVNVIVDDGYS